MAVLAAVRAALASRPRRLLAEWAAVSGCATVLAAALLLTGASARLDNIIYDAALRSAPRAADPGVIIVAIDDRSLAELGAWPWPRRLHAALIDQLAQAGARAVGYDVLFVEPSPDDAELARAVAAAGRVCLPVLIEAPGPDGDSFRVVAPVGALAGAAAGLGHVDLDYDPDGVSRRANLAQTAGGRGVGHLMRCLRDVGRHGRLAEPHLPRPDGGRSLVRGDTVLIPYGGRPGRVRTVSAVSVIRGEVPADFLRGRHVIVGATAAGLHDRHSTPVSTDNEAMAGVEVQANLLEGLLSGRFIRIAPVWAGLAFTLALVWAFLASLPALSPRRNLALGFAVMALALAVSIIALVAARFWLAPSPTILTLLVVFPLWGWRRLEAAHAYMVTELEGFSQEADVLDGGGLPPASGDVVERRITLLHHAIARARNLRAFAAAAAAQRDRVIQLLTHDMRSPQSSILALVETTGADKLDPDTGRRLSAYARRTLALADNFVHLAKAESGKLSAEVFDLADVAVEAIDDLWPLATKADVKLHTQGEDRERLVAGDRSLIARAVINLLDNAVKYSPAGGTVTVALDEADGMVRLSVADQGQGLTPAQQAGLFQRFERVASSGAAGIGLGLTLVDEVARRHGGSVTVDSAPGAGATFTLSLPLASDT